jgi:hypothetical protein
VGTDAVKLSRIGARRTKRRDHPGPCRPDGGGPGYAAAGGGGGLPAVLIAFAPAFIFVLAGGPRFDQIPANASVQAFLIGAGPAVIGAIAWRAEVWSGEPTMSIPPSGYPARK